MVEQIQVGNFDNLPLTHHLSAGFKSYMSDETLAMVEVLRQACGGAGFLKASGFAMIMDKITPFPTFEGVNVVLYHQTAKLALKQARAALKDKPLIPIFSHFAELKTAHQKKTKGKSSQDFRNVDILDDALKTHSLYYIQALLIAFNSSKETHTEKENVLFGDL